VLGKVYASAAVALFLMMKGYHNERA
jgi:hypothetical protein